MPRNTAVDWFRLIYPFFCGLWVVSPVTNIVLVGFMPHFQTHPATVSYHRLDHISSYILHMMIFNEEHVFFLVPKHVLRKLIFSATEIQVFIFHPCLVRIPSKSSLRSWWRTSRWRIPVVKRWKRKPRFWFQNVESVAILWWKKLMKTEEFWGTSDSDKDFFHCDFLSELVDYAVLNPMVRSIGSF